LKEFKDKFGIEGITSIEKFNSVVSQDKKVRRWFRDLKAEFDKINRLPEHSLLEGVPDEVKDIVLNESKRLSDFYAKHDRKVKELVEEYKRNISELDNEVRRELKTYSKYTLVSTLTIDDVPISEKRNIFVLEQDDQIRIIRKEVVLEYKKKCFENLIKNKGEFKDFEDPFEVK